MEFVPLRIARLNAVVVKLTRGKYALVDPEFWPLVSQYKWRATITTTIWYAIAWTRGGAKHRRHIYLHKLLCPAWRVVDHINGNGLDNRISNLREATYSQNSANRRDPRRNRWSEYRGITRYVGKSSIRWRAMIMVKGKTLSLGVYATEIEAAKAYDRAARHHFGAFATTNFKA